MVTGFLWRLLFGVLVVRAVRVAVRWAPRAVLAGGALALWPSVALAVGLRRWGLSRLAARWPRAGRWAAPALALAGGLVVAALVVLPAAQRNAVWTIYTAGWLVPVAVPAGLLPPVLALQTVATALPLWVAGGVVLAGLWPAYAPLVARLRRSPAAKPDGSRATGDRRSANAVGPGDSVPVVLRPVPTQRIATATFGADAWTVKPLYGPALLSMVVAPPGVGKTELVYGSLAAALDGLPFVGLETARPRRVLLLSEMEPKTIQPALLRWGFVARPAPGGWRRWRDALALRFARPADSPGHLIDVVHASDAFAPAEDGRRPQWADVIRAAVPLVKRAGYDLVIVDSLARWMGNDSSNAAMLDALGALRQVTRLGAGVIAPHHCAKDAQAPYAPRGGSAILGELDLCWSLAHPEGRVTVEALRDPRRVLEAVKSRFSEDTPPPIRLERVDADPDAPRARYGYRLIGDAAAPSRPAGTGTRTVSAPAGTVEALPEQQRRVLAALCAAPDRKATTPELAAASGVPDNRVREAAVELIRRGCVNVAGAGESPAKGGRRPTRYTATAYGVQQLALGAPVAPAAIPAAPVVAGGAPPAETAGAADRLLSEALGDGD